MNQDFKSQGLHSPVRWRRSLQTRDQENQIHAIPDPRQGARLRRPTFPMDGVFKERGGKSSQSGNPAGVPHSSRARSPSPPDLWCRGPPACPCCRLSLHLLAASGLAPAQRRPPGSVHKAQFSIHCQLIFHKSPLSVFSSPRPGQAATKPPKPAHLCPTCPEGAIAWVPPQTWDRSGSGTCPASPPPGHLFMAGRADLCEKRNRDL